VNQLAVGVVGVGEMGRRHAENLRHLVPGARLMAIADADAERAGRTRVELEIEKSYTSVEALVEQKDIDAVVIAAPDKFHAGAVEAAALAGKAIFCEKPIAVSMEDAHRALAAVAKAGVFLQVGHMRRYDPAYLDAKKRIEAGEIGEPLIFKAIARDRDAPPLSSYQAALNGSLFVNSAVHDFDLARWMMNSEVAEVHTFATVLTRPEVAKYGDVVASIVNLRYSNSAIGSVESYVAAVYGYDIRTEIVGSKGTVQIGYLQKTADLVLTGAGVQHDAVGHWLVRFADAYLSEMRDFVKKVLAGGPPRVTGEDGRRALAIALAAERSHHEGRPLPVAGLQAQKI